MKNCAVAEWGSCVRAIAIVPRAFLKPVVGLIFDRSLCALLLHVSRETATLNHEIVDDPVKYRAVVVAVARRKTENSRRFWGHCLCRAPVS